MNKLVSILMPAYNAEKWIGGAIVSALNQTIPKKEIIIIDDGSGDNTLQIAKRFESKAVKVVSQRNKGASAARNRAFSYAQGEYIQWLDADDLLAPDKIESQLKYCAGEDRSRVLFSSAFAMFYHSHSRAKQKPDQLWQDLSPVEWLLAKFNHTVWMNPAVWLMSRELAEHAGHWNEDLSLDDDGEYFCRAVAASERVKFVKEAQSYYRIGNSGSLSERKSDVALESLFRSISLCIDHLRRLEDSERTRAACVNFLQSQLWYFYPEKDEYVKKLYGLAGELGTDLHPPKESLKFSLVHRLFGRKVAKRMKIILWRAEIAVCRTGERLLDFRRFEFQKNRMYKRTIGL